MPISEYIFTVRDNHANRNFAVSAHESNLYRTRSAALPFIGFYLCCVSVAEKSTAASYATVSPVSSKNSTARVCCTATVGTEVVLSSRTYDIK